MRILLGIVYIVAILMGSPTAAWGETVTVLDHFSIRKDTTKWSAVDKAEIDLEGKALQIRYPQYAPGEPARWPRATREVSGTDFTQFNGLCIDLENPTAHSQFLQLGFLDGNDSQGQLGYWFGPGERRTLTVRFDESHPSGHVDWSDVQTLDLMRTQPARPMTWNLYRIEFFTDNPDKTFAGQLNELYKKTADALKQAKASKLISEAFENRATQTMQRWGQALRQPRGLAGQMEKCETELSAIHGHVRTLVLARQLASPLVAWTVPLGTAFRPSEALLQYERPAEEISVYAASGQYEESLVRLTNLTENVQDLRLRFRSADTVILPSLSIRRNQSVKAEDKSIIGDVLVPLDEVGAVSVAPFQTVELWLRVDAKNHLLASDRYCSDLEIVDLRRGAESAMKLPVSITIRNFDLASVPQQFKVQAWAELFAGRSFVVRGNEQAALKNLLDYGINVLNLEPDQMPWPKLTPAGDLAAPIDYRLHDQTLTFLRQKGSPLILIFMNLDDNNPANWGLRSGLAAGSPQWERGLQTWLTDWTQHLRSQGLTTRDYALYLTDEPGPEELDRYRTVGRIIRAIDPSIQIYINAGEIYDDPKLNDALMEVTDIWQPDETVGFAADPDLLSTLKNYPGKQLWVYACRTAMRSRQCNAHDYYRLMAWRAMRDGLSGIGYWSYCAAASENEDLWDGTREPASGAVLVYPTEHGVLSSVRWELIRQSVDDTKYVQLLRQAAGQTTSDALRSRIEALCSARLVEIIVNRDDPSIIVQWRIDAGQAIEDSLSEKK